ASPVAPLSARCVSCARRASDSMMRSSTTSCAILSAVPTVDLSNATTLDGTVPVGIGGRIHSGADAETGPEFFGGGRAAAAAPETQLPTAGPVPTLSRGAGRE